MNNKHFWWINIPLIIIVGYFIIMVSYDNRYTKGYNEGYYNGEGYELDMEVFYTCYKHPEGFTKEPVCRKKELSDLSCDELEKAFECNKKKWNKYIYERCFGSDLLWSKEDEVLFLMIKNGCGLTTKE